MWTIIKRVFLFVLVNILVLITLAIAFYGITGLLNVPVRLQGLAWFYYGIIGFLGAFVSLAYSRKLAKKVMNVRVIEPNSSNERERKLVALIHGLATRAGLKKMPEVGIYESDEVNAFATGPSRSRSLVAVSTKLLDQIDGEALEGVIAHEVSHIANGDMVTMTLLQGVINTLVLILARMIASTVASSFEERSRPSIKILTFFLLQLILSSLGSFVVCYFSRRREFRADAGGAALAGKENMLKGLRSFREVYGHVDDLHQSLASLKISGHSTRTLVRLLATHPPLEERIARLESMSA